MKGSVTTDRPTCNRKRLVLVEVLGAEISSGTRRGWCCADLPAIRLVRNRREPRKSHLDRAAAMNEARPSRNRSVLDCGGRAKRRRRFGSCQSPFQGKPK